MTMHETIGGTGGKTRFTIYPAIDLRKGQVVRLAQGDPDRQKTYSSDPTRVAIQWLNAGARWLHVVNLDGAFGENDEVGPDEVGSDRVGPDPVVPNRANQVALQAILAAVLGQSRLPKAKVQFGGGLRTLEQIERVLSLGVQRVILGTTLIEKPQIVIEALQRYGSERIAAALDASQGIVRTHGWAHGSGKEVLVVGKDLAELGLRTVIYTDIKRDGMGTGADIATAQSLAALGLEVIASGGIHSLQDVLCVKQAGLSGVIIGRALYEGNFRLEEALAC